VQNRNLTQQLLCDRLGHHFGNVHYRSPVVPIRLLKGDWPAQFVTMRRRMAVATRTSPTAAVRLKLADQIVDSVGSVERMLAEQRRHDPDDGLPIASAKRHRPHALPLVRVHGTRPPDSVDA
jgi:hypothetical protein